MPHYNPSDPQSFLQRDKLLQTCLRPDPLPFSIAEEYPIVLSARGSRYSYCMSFEDKLCSHANLWPRRVFDTQKQQKFQIGLVGNVATDPERQGQGLMRNLLSALEDTARDQALDALMLWSDLSQFYHKLGFKSVGKEYHIHFQGPFSKPLSNIEANPPPTSSLLESILAIRYTVPLTLERSVEEFHNLLSIPCLDLLILRQKQNLLAYALVGKGYDMMGVIHEWGACDLSSLHDLIQGAGWALNLEQTMLLAPSNLSEEWLTSLGKKSSSVESVPMALLKPLRSDLQAEDFNSLFVWGLDSI